MNRYKDIIEKINQIPTNYNFSKLPAENLEKELLFGEVPIDYLDFLREVGDSVQFLRVISCFMRG